MSALIAWPPRDAAALKLWLLDELPLLRERRDMIAERIAKGEAVLHQPTSSRLSQINIARTTTSDPTFDVVALWADELPHLRRELLAMDAILDEYRRVKTALTERQRKLIEWVYEYYLAPSEACVGLAVSRRTYDRDHHDALALMVSILEWQSEGA